MESLIPEYEPISLIGSGVFGYVLEAYDHLNDVRVAIKRSYKVGTKISREVEILNKIKNCKYVVKLIDTFYTIDIESKIIQNMIFEYVKNALDRYIDSFRKNKKFIPIEKIKILSNQILKGLDYCHKLNIVHRDLKPENILITENEEIKICDFGSSKIINNDSHSTPYITSRYYRAPELILGKSNYDYKIDIFALGCIISELFTLTPLFPGKTEGSQIFEHICIIGNPGKEYFSQFNIPQNFLNYYDAFKISSINLEEIINFNSFYPKKEIKIAADLILNMLNWDCTARYDAERCLQHPFYKELGQEKPK